MTELMIAKGGKNGNVVLAPGLRLFAKDRIVVRDTAMPGHIAAQQNDGWMLRGNLRNQPAAHSRVCGLALGWIREPRIAVIDNRKRHPRMLLFNVE
jgi:hypothetical protein